VCSSDLKGMKIVLGLALGLGLPRKRDKRYKEKKENKIRQPSTGTTRPRPCPSRGYHLPLIVPRGGLSPTAKKSSQGKGLGKNDDGISSQGEAKPPPLPIRARTREDPQFSTEILRFLCRRRPCRRCQACRTKRLHPNASKFSEKSRTKDFGGTAGV
jgi:hypothetical protein